MSSWHGSLAVLAHVGSLAVLAHVFPEPRRARSEAAATTSRPRAQHARLQAPHWEAAHCASTAASGMRRQSSARPRPQRTPIEAASASQCEKAALDELIRPFFAPSAARPGVCRSARPAKLHQAQPSPSSPPAFLERIFTTVHDNYEQFSTALPGALTRQGCSRGLRRVG